MRFEKEHLVLVIIVCAIFIGFTALFYYNPSDIESPAQSWLEDPEGDVILNAGTDYPNIIDITYVELEVSEGVINFTINVRDSIPDHLDEGEYAQWMAVIILQDIAYELYAEINSTIYQGELSGYVREVGSQEAEYCNVVLDGESLILSAPLDGLQTAKEIQWFIQTMFEKWSGYELVSNGFDFAPDEDLQRTNL
jgi:hypothetical protein